MLHRAGGEDRAALAILGDEADPAPGSRRAACASHGPSCTSISPLARMPPPSASPSSLLPRADEPGDRRRSPPRAHRRSLPPPSRRASSGRGPRAPRTPCSISRLRKRSVISRPTIMRTSAVPVSPGAERCRQVAVAKHGGRRRALVDLAQPVRDEDDRDAAVAELRQPLEEALRRRLRQRARGLVEDEHAATRPRRRAPPLPPAAARCAASPTSCADRRGRRGRRARPWHAAMRRPPVDRRRARRGRRPMRMFSATVSVGASVSSWLIATMPCSIA